MADKRSHTRVEADLTVRFADERGGFLEECVGNISKGGVFIETFTPRKVGEVVDLQLRIPHGNEEIAVQGEVVHVRGAAKGDDPEQRERAGMGIRFTILDAKQKTELRAFIDSLVEAGGAGSRRESRIYSLREIHVRPKDAKDFKKRMMPNISRGGLFIETNDEFELFETIDVALLPLAEGPEKTDAVHLNGEVVHVRRQEEKVTGIGVKFSKLSAETTKALKTYMRRVLHEMEN